MRHSRDSCHQKKKTMGIFSKWFGKHDLSDCKSTLPVPAPFNVKKRVSIIAQVDIQGDSVSIKVSGLECVNVCLASFLTKGISYAQEKYNEYQANKDVDAIVEDPKVYASNKGASKREIEALREWSESAAKKLTKKQAKRE